MRPRSRHLVLLASICGLLALPACERPSQLAGHAIGQYEVHGTLLESQCGEGHAAPSALWFFVELRDEDGALGYWKLPDSPIMDGTLDSTGFSFEAANQVVGVPSQPELGVAGCVVERAEIVTGEFGSAVATSDAGNGADAGVGDASVPGGDPVDPQSTFTGTTTVRITPVPGGDCSPLLLPYGGAFPTLPCEIRYSLSGERLDEPLW